MYCTRSRNGSPRRRSGRTRPHDQGERRNEVRAAARGRRSTSTTAPRTSTIVVRMCRGPPPRPAARPPPALAVLADPPEHGQGQRQQANEIEKGNSPAIVLAMFPPQMVNCSVGVAWDMNRNTVAAQAASSRLAQAQHPERRPAGHREQEDAQRGHQLERHLVAEGRVSRAMSAYGSGSRRSAWGCRRTSRAPSRSPAPSAAAPRAGTRPRSGATPCRRPLPSSGSG